jgi:hypothetical protein
MATQNTTNDGILNLPFPLATDPVDVHGDLAALVDRLKIVLPPLGFSQFQIPVRNISGQNLLAGTPVISNGSVLVNNSPRVTIEKALPSSENPILGLIQTDLNNNEDGVAIVAGVMDGIDLSSGTFINGEPVYIGSDGWITGTRPVSGNATAVGVVVHAALDGMLVVQAKGNGTWGALKDGLS